MKIPQRVLFINPITPPNILQVRVSLGVASLSAILKREGYKTSLYCPYEFNSNELDCKILNFLPSIIAISSVSDQFALSEKIIDFIYIKYHIPMIMGGIHATVAPEECIKTKVLGVCIGEGDLAVLEFVNKFSSEINYLDTKNFWFKNKGKIVKNSLRPLIQDLDSLPFPDREIFDEYMPKENVILEFMFSRGCPFRCSYCINHVIQGYYGFKGFLRQRSVDNAICEIKKVVADYKNNHNNNPKITMHDDTFTLNKLWLKEFCKKYKKEINLPYACNVRVETMTEDIVIMLKKSGCFEVKIGIESGNEKIRKVILNRQMTNKQIIDCFKLCHKYDIPTSSFNMIGVPGETEETILDTINLNKLIKPSVVGVSIFNPYPGTGLYKICKEKGYISERKTSSFNEGISIVNLPTISHERIEFYYKIFQTAIYRPWLLPIIKLSIYCKIYDPIYISYYYIRRKLAGIQFIRGLFGK